MFSFWAKVLPIPVEPPYLMNAQSLMGQTEDKLALKNPELTKPGKGIKIIR
ncbi:hypothetical protein SPLC1_S200710 [Arthrospira platensis C1]|nr:hypothetical protein SPLC1_S200710 [Arthrospira platensis C1]